MGPSKDKTSTLAWDAAPKCHPQVNLALSIESRGEYIPFHPRPGLAPGNPFQDTDAVRVFTFSPARNETEKDVHSVRLWEHSEGSNCPQELLPQQMNKIGLERRTRTFSLLDPSQALYH